MSGFRTGLSAVLVSVWLSGCAPPGTGTSTRETPAPRPSRTELASRTESASSVAEALIKLTNSERTHAGLRPFAPNDLLMKAAQIQADQLVRSGRLEHVIRGARYPRPVDRIEAVGYRWQAIAENLAFNERNAAGAVHDWMNSAGHRKNILDSRYTEIGTGYARDAARQPYYVQVFARPAP
jgi:uncharacterized protein YkwD